MGCSDNERIGKHGAAVLDLRRRVARVWLGRWRLPPPPGDLVFVAERAPVVLAWLGPGWLVYFNFYDDDVLLTTSTTTTKTTLVILFPSTPCKEQKRRNVCLQIFILSYQPERGALDIIPYMEKRKKIRLQELRNIPSPYLNPSLNPYSDQNKTAITNTTPPPPLLIFIPFAFLCKRAIYTLLEVTK